jgi:hypothetical protein
MKTLNLGTAVFCFGVGLVIILSNQSLICQILALIDFTLAGFNVWVSGW